MGTDIFNDDLLAYAQVFKVMTAPLGDRAPRPLYPPRLSGGKHSGSGIACP